MVTSFIVNYYSKIYPRIYINNTLVGGLTEPQAFQLLSEKEIVPQKLSVTINSSTGSKTVDIPTTEIGAQFEYEKAIAIAYELGRSGNVLYDFNKIIESLQNPLVIPLSLKFEDTQLNTEIDALSQEAGTPPSYPHFVLKNGDVVIANGTPGDVLPHEYVVQNISDALLQKHTAIFLNTKVVDTALTTAEAESALQRANALNEKNVVLTLDSQNLQTIRVDKLIAFLNPKGGYDEVSLRNFATTISQENNREVTEPVFNFDGKRVQEFRPGENGVVVNQEQLYQNFSIALSTLERSTDNTIALEIPHDKSVPQTSVSDVNNLGIKELLGTGTSRFSGSIPSRVHNVALASSRINGVLVPPGETFSFANAIGDVSKYTGYQEAYIIQGGHTILGDGGGVCQVSTTLFRAVMSAGLPIVERHPHAYRVGYYEQDSGPGLDATVYVPTVDFKFLNDTGSYVLVQTSVDTKKLTAEFKIYGTSDGRKATIGKPVVTDQIAPQEDQYIDDPTLPLGKINQVEHKAWGARVSFSYSVEKNGQEIYRKNFVSVYQPWKAVYMRGVGPA